MASPAAPPDTPRTKVEDKNFFHLTIIIIFGVFATTLPQPQVLGKLPLQHLLKDTLQVKPDQMSFFFLACGLAWYIKPLAGIFTDAFPIFGTRRRHYMLISCVLAALSWIGLWVAWEKFGTYSALLWGSIIVNVFMVMASTVTGAFLVEAGQSFGATGRLTSVRMFVQNACLTFNGIGGGLLASVAFLWTAGVNAALVLSLFPIVYIFLREKRVRGTNAQSFENAGRQLSTIGKSPVLWAGLGFIFLFYFAPGFSTLQYYRQTNELKFDSKYIGILQTIGGSSALVASIIYAYMIKRVQLKTMIFIGILLAGLGTIFYLPMFYTNRITAIPVEMQNGLLFGLAEIALMDLAARATPVGCEGMGFGLILSMRNVAIFGADYLGSKAQGAYPKILTFSTMVWINSATTLIVLVLLPFLPAAIMRTKDKARASEPDPELRAPEDDI
jgi:MFS family permease